MLYLLIFNNYIYQSCGIFLFTEISKRSRPKGTFVILNFYLFHLSGISFFILHILVILIRRTVKLHRVMLSGGFRSVSSHYLHSLVKLIIQFSSCYMIHARWYLFGKGICYLRTVIVTANVSTLFRFFMILLITTQVLLLYR